MVKKISSTGGTGQAGAYMAKLLLSNRPAGVDLLIGDYSKAKGELSWQLKT